MRPRLKPLDRQVIVVTGASSGIGLATARRAARAGAKVVLIARNGEALVMIAEAIARDGGGALPIVADVGDADALAAAAREAAGHYGRIDTWVNAAGVGIYGPLSQVSAEDHERLFRTNYFGVVNGTLEAMKHLPKTGGAVINVGSVLSDVGVPLLGAYAASKHAVKGFTQSLRMEMARERRPVSVTLIKPSSISTPFPEHTKNLTGDPLRTPPPAYAPEVVARAILHAARHPVRQLIVGFGARPMVLAAAVAPRLADSLFGRVAPPLMRWGGVRPKVENLDRPGNDGHVQTWRYNGLPFSLYTQAQMHPGLIAAAGLLGLATGALWLGRRQASR